MIFGPIRAVFFGVTFVLTGYARSPEKIWWRSFTVPGGMLEPASFEGFDGTV
jgi:hypothetical protein